MVTLAVGACLPLSNLDAAARGDELATTGGSTGAAGNTEGGSPVSTGGVPEGTGSTPATTGGGVGEGGSAGLAGGNGGLAGGNGGVPGGNGGVPVGAAHAGAATAGGNGGRDPETGGTGGGPQCKAPMLDCDDNPSDCETDITRSTDHCGRCDNRCPGPSDRCIYSECVPPCTMADAVILSHNIPRSVPGNGCVGIADHLPGNYYVQVDRDVDYSFGDQCGNGSDGTFIRNQAELLPACPMWIDLQSTSSDVEIRWWAGG